jgi:hypothetical protein
LWRGLRLVRRWWDRRGKNGKKLRFLRFSGNFLVKQLVGISYYFPVMVTVTALSA